MPSQPSYSYQNFFEKGAASLFEYLPRATNIGTNQLLKLRKQPSNLFFIFAILSSLLTINLSNTAYAAERVWTAGTATEANHWKSVAYGNGVWIAVSINRTNVSQIMRSTDNGVNWTAATGAGATGNTFFMSAAYGANNTWIAVSQHGPVVKSTDNGSSWSIIDPTAYGGNKEWLAVAYGNGVWVVTSKQTDVIVSSDGDLWHSRSQPAWVNGYEFRSLAYGTATGNTPRWVAVNQSHGCNCLTSRVMTSDDNGTTWTYRTAAQDYKWESVTYGDGVWVAVSSSGTGNRVMTSPDGITWTSRNSIGDFEWVSVSYGVEEDGTKRWVAVSQETFRASMTSTDNGVTWTSQTIPAPSSAVTWQGLGYGNGIWVAVGASGVMRLVAALAAPAFTLSSTTETRTVNTAATGFTINSTGGAIASFAINATPPGMSFNTTTGALTGTPNTVAAATNYTITATNASGNTTRTFTLTVTVAAPAFTLSSSSESKTVNTAISGYTISSTGGTIASYAISPAAPAGLTFNTTTGLLTGTPTEVAASTAYTITATNATSSTTQTFTLTVTAVPVVATNSAAEAAAQAEAARRANEQRQMGDLSSVLPLINELLKEMEEGSMSTSTPKKKSPIIKAKQNTSTVKKSEQEKAKIKNQAKAKQNKKK